MNRGKNVFNALMPISSLVESNIVQFTSINITLVFAKICPISIKR